jgi:hypothetical protein
MDELVKMVVQKTGISEDLARRAVDTVVGYLKGKLPAPIASQLDGAIAGGGGAGTLGEMAKKAGGLLGGE